MTNARDRDGVAVWIDAASAAQAERLFGLAPVERHLKALRRLDPPPAEIVLSGGPRPADVPGLPVRWIDEPGPTGERLAAFLTRSGVRSGNGATLVVDGASVVDPRLLAYLARVRDRTAARGGAGAERAAVLRLETGNAAALDLDHAASSVLAVADRLIAAGRIHETRPEEFPSFVANLRRDLPFHLFAVPDLPARLRRERFLFWSNYKGSTDFLTKWIFPPIVWPLVRLAARWRIHPNWVTLASVLLAFAAVPFFAAGAFGIGLVVAYVMAILDSVDGKLARLTLTDSPLGNALDHGLDIVHPPLWYLAWAWGLGGRSLDHPVLQAGLLLVAFYVLDRLVLMVPKARFKRGLHAIAPIDAAVRTIIARRNVNMFIFTVGVALGAAVPAFYVVVLWQGLTLAWHAGRVAWLVARPPAISAKPA